MPRKKRDKNEQEPAAARGPGETRRITPVDIQQKEFGLALRGYNERDVDQFLDDVTEEVARLYADNKRLREEVEFARTSRLNLGGADEAEGVVRKAREEAARLLADARARASAMSGTGVSGQESTAGPATAPGAGSAAALAPFVAQEREFLQSLANLIQTHAEAVKDHIRRARDAAAAQAALAQAAAKRMGRERATRETPGEPGTDEPVAAESVVSMAASENAGAKEPSAGQAFEDPEIEQRSGPPTQPWVPEELHATGSQEWKGYYASPDRSQMSEEPEASAPGRDEIVDLTATSPDRSVVGGEETEGSEVDRRYLELQRAAREAEPPEDDSSEDRSIRELFWGEDS